MRQGKGILSTFIALAFAECGGEVLTNYTINNPSCRKISFYEFLELLTKPRRATPTLICIDELPTWIDSYCTTQSKSNRYASHFCNQSAKLGYDLVYTAQRTRRADINYREMVDVSFRAVKDEEQQFFNYVLLDASVIDEDVETNQSLSIPFGVAANWWSLYDTFEPVTPEGLSDFMVEIEKSDYKKMVATVDRQVQKLKGKNVRYLPSVVAAELALMDVGESPVFAKYVKERLSSR